jgi:hypothetical protein
MNQKLGFETMPLELDPEIQGEIVDKEIKFGRLRQFTRTRCIFSPSTVLGKFGSLTYIAAKSYHLLHGITAGWINVSQTCEELSAQTGTCVAQPAYVHSTSVPVAPPQQMYVSLVSVVRAKSTGLQHSILELSIK